MRTLSRILLSGAAAALFLVSIPWGSRLSGQDKVYEIADFTARLELLADGSYRIREDITYDFQVGSFTFATRDIPLSNSDGVANVSVRSSQVVIGEVRQEESGNTLELRWEFPEETGPVTFTVEYDLLGALRNVDERNEIFWRVVGEDWDVPFQQVTADVILPEELGIQASAVTPDPADIAALVSSDDALIARFVPGGLPAGRAYQVRVSFPKIMEGRLVGLARPERQALLAGILGGLLTALLGGILAYRKGGVRLPPRRQATPGVDIPTAAVLLHKAAPGWDRAFPATLFDLGNRGVVAMERVDRKGKVFTTQKVLLRLNADAGVSLTGFELALLEELQEFREDLGKFSSSGKKFRAEAMKRVRDGLVVSGSLHDGRKAGNRALMWGLLLLVAFFVAAVVAGAAGHPWLAALAGGGCGAGVGLLFIGGVRYPVTRQGAEQVAALKGYLEAQREDFKQQVKMSPIAAAEFFFTALPWLTLDPKYYGAEGRKLTKVLKKETRALHTPSWAMDSTRAYEKAIRNRSAAYAAFLPFNNITAATAGAVSPGSGGGAVGGAAGGGAAGGGGGGAG